MKSRASTGTAATAGLGECSLLQSLFCEEPVSIREVPSVHLRRAGYVAMLAILFYGLARPAAAADIWLSAIDPVVQREQKHNDAPKDYMDLFRPDAPWTTAASGLKAFKISTQFGLRSTDDELSTLVNDLQRRHIGLAIELGILVGTDRCGTTVEGYAAPHAVEVLARRIKKFGGRIDYVAMDEPVWMGHVAKGVTHPEIRGAVRCQDSVADLVEQIAPKVAILREIFPNIQVGDIDPINASTPSEIDDLAQFADLFLKKTTVPLAFVHADISWDTHWQPLLEALAEHMHKRGIRLGVICNGDPTDVQNEEWVSKALQRCRTIAADPKIKADDFIVQSWHPVQTKMLPETDPGALTFAAKQAETMFH
jgi:hypothetical protein